MHRTLRVLSLVLSATIALGLTSACSSGVVSEGTRPLPGDTALGRTTPGGRGAYAFTAEDTPYTSVLAEARRRNQPALLFFWTSW